MPRPSLPEPSTRKNITLPDRVWEQVSEYRHANKIASEADALRRLIDAGLSAPEKAKPVSYRRRKEDRA